MRYNDTCCSAHVVRDTGIWHSVDLKWLREGYGSRQSQEEGAVVQRTFLKNVSGKHELNMSWWRASSNIEWLYLDNNDSMECI